MCLTLRKRRAILDGHGLPDDELGYFRVGTVHPSVVDVERIALGALHHLDLRALGEERPELRAHVLHHFLHLGEFLVITHSGVADAHRHAEHLTEGIPKCEHVLLRDGLRGSLEQQPETIGLPSLDEPIGERRSMIVYACPPVLPKVGDDPSILWDDILTGDEAHARIARAAVAILDEVAQFNE